MKISLIKSAFLPTFFLLWAEDLDFDVFSGLKENFSEVDCVGIGTSIPRKLAIFRLLMT